MYVTEFRLKLYPKDFRKVRAFYEITLGLPMIRDWDTATSKGVMFQVAGTVLELLSPPADHVPVAGADVSWEVADVRALWEEMKSTQPIVHVLRDNSWGDTSFCISDPEGFQITFFTKH